MKKRWCCLVFVLVLCISFTVPAFAAVTDGDFEMDTIVMPVYDSDRVTLLYYAVYTKYEWKSVPKYAHEDRINVNWDRDALTLVPDTFYYKTSYKTKNSDLWLEDSDRAMTSPEQSRLGNVDLTFDLRDDCLLRGTVYFQLAPVNDSISDWNVCVNSNYAHSTTIQSVTLRFSGISYTRKAQLQASGANITIP